VLVLGTLELIWMISQIFFVQPRTVPVDPLLLVDLLIIIAVESGLPLPSR
jgi:hypothetical protein